MVWNWENPQWLYVIYNYVQYCKSGPHSVDCIGMNQLFKYSGLSSSYVEIQFLFCVIFYLFFCRFAMLFVDELILLFYSTEKSISNLFIVHKSYHGNNTRYCFFFYLSD